MHKSDALLLLDSEELSLVQTKYTGQNQLLFAIMLKFFQAKGYYPSQNDMTEPALVMSLSCQLGIELLDDYDFNWQTRSVERFRHQIRNFLGYKKANNSFVERLITHLMEHSIAKCLTQEQYKEIAYQFFKDLKLEPFSANKIERYIASSIHRFEHKFFTKITSLLSVDSKAMIDNLLKREEIEPDKTTNRLEQIDPKNICLWQLKKDIAGAKLKLVEDELQKLKFLQAILLPNDLLGMFDRKLLIKYYNRIMAFAPSHINEYASDAKYGMMAIFIYIRSQMIIDNLAEVLLQLIHKMRTSAETFIKQNILADVTKIGGKFDILYDLAKVSLDHPNGIIKKRIYDKVAKHTLEKIVQDHSSSKGKWYQNQVKLKIRSLYSHGHRKILLTLLASFDFSSNEDSKDLVAAIEFIINNDNITAQYYPDTSKVPMKAIATSWQDMVIEKCPKTSKAQINCFHYEIAVLEELGKYLNCKKLWISDAYRFRNPQEDTPQDFDERADYYYGLLKLPLSPKEFTKQLKKELSTALASLNTNIPDNHFVKITGKKTKARIVITPAEAQNEPVNLHILQQTINKRFATINLIDILKEADFRTNFTSNFHTVANKEAIDQDKLLKRLLLCLYATGSNIGLKRVSGANEDSSYADLRYVKRRYINIDNVRAAIVDVVNALIKIRDPKIWSEATTACSCDSKKIACWDQNLMSQWHTRYRGRGVMIYWHIDQNSACIYSQLKTCSSSEVGAMINGFLKHDSRMNMNKAYIDTHGQSVIGFAISNLLSFALLPRIKGINKQKLYYANKGDKKLYKNLDLILKGSINWDLIEKYYHEVVRYIAALKTGTVEADVMIKHLSSDNYDHPVYKALTEIGNAVKTIFLCQYIDSQDLRIEINEALNIVERVNSIMGFIFYGKLGEISSNNKDEQELAIVCLHLLQVCMVYINTLLIQEVLSDQALYNKLTKEDKRGLTPLIHSHINPYGLFPLDLNQRLIITQSPVSQNINRRLR